MHPLVSFVGYFCRFQERWMDEKGEEKKKKKKACPPAQCSRINQLCGDPGYTCWTYIWYSSIASTNCPHESKSVPFLKLACHFCTVLLTSDMLAGRIPAALSGQHSRGGDSSAGLELQRRQPGCVLSGGATDRPVTPRPSPFCLLTLISHPQQRGSPAWKLGVRAFQDAGSPEWTATGCLFNNDGDGN